ncbi:hypothetical protein [Azospirillum halopraeferens]|uniref:hypothetical protein n=1 Tax=Azospirillum halopraeferens TaxID=34010 RepID=UPI0004078C4F|nr:hypothetical protein [Azospirillum halopraeferens]
MNIIYAYPSDRGHSVQSDVLGLLRARFGGVETRATEVRDSLHGNGTDTVVTVEVGEVHREAAIATIRSHPDVIDAAPESFGERA